MASGYTRNGMPHWSRARCRHRQQERKQLNTTQNRSMIPPGEQDEWTRNVGRQSRLHPKPHGCLEHHQHYMTPKHIATGHTAAPRNDSCLTLKLKLTSGASSLSFITMFVAKDRYFSFFSCSPERITARSKRQSAHQTNTPENKPWWTTATDQSCSSRSSSEESKWSKTEHA